jgi:hypothetical protein
VRSLRRNLGITLEITILLATVTTITSIMTVITLILTYRQNAQRDKPQFELTALNLGHPPDRKLRGIHIQNPTKAISYCQVFCNGIVLETQFADKTRTWVYVHVGGSATFIIPEKLTGKDAFIVVKDGRRTLQKIRLGDLPYVL